MIMMMMRGADEGWSWRMAFVVRRLDGGGRLLRVDVRGLVLGDALGDRRAAGVGYSALLRARAR